MEDDPLPAPKTNYPSSLDIDDRQRLRKSIALLLCLFIGLALILYPQVVVKQTQNELWITKNSSGINQAPRVVFLGALDVLAQKLDIHELQRPKAWGKMCALSPETVLKFRCWIVMVWYGATYG